MSKTILLLILTGLFVSGCFLYRHDTTYSQDGTILRDSKTLWTLFKDYNLDPNSISSKSHNMKIITPYGVGETK